MVAFQKFSLKKYPAFLPRMLQESRLDLQGGSLGGTVCGRSDQLGWVEGIGSVHVDN